MEQNKILLSICIPTYNRADVLRDVLEKITSDPAFDQEVEIIISDNHSTDHAKEVALPFQDKYPNVFYYRNTSNLPDKNFAIALNYGKGEYLKLQNDYIFYREGKLSLMKEHIRKNLERKKPLFFYQKVKGGKKYKNQELICNSLDEFISIISFRCTWINNFGCWRQHFKNLDDKERCVSYLLSQVDWTYRVVLNQQGAVIISDKITERMPSSMGSRGGYNYWKVHIENYYKIMQEFVKSKDIALSTYNKDRKYSLTRYSDRYVRFILLPKEGHSYEATDSLQYFWKYYKDIPIFYLIILEIGTIYLGKSIHQMFRRLLSKVRI